MTPGAVKTRLAASEFTDGVPDDATVRLVYDYLDLRREVQVFLTAVPGASQLAIQTAIRRFGPKAPAEIETNWLQTDPGKRWNMLSRPYSRSSRGSTRPGSRVISNRWISPGTARDRAGTS